MQINCKCFEFTLMKLNFCTTTKYSKQIKLVNKIVQTFKMASEVFDWESAKMKALQDGRGREADRNWRSTSCSEKNLKSCSEKIIKSVKTKSKLE